ncbi:MAG: hypothetical protein JWQ12_1392 [Glaciihabitans sp.]|nr:hypothetical protein [Glaciihabitans sp.]
MASTVLDETFRREWPRILAAVIRYTGSIDLAEDSVQEAFLRAAASRERELLINPAAWITTVAKRIAVDTVRRDASLRTKLPLLATEEARPMDLTDDLESPGGDDRLGLLFVACNPELAPETRLALALRFVCGIPTARIAEAMLVTHTAMSARLTRAKQQIERDGIRFTPPDEFERGHRLDDVLGVVHLLYTVGHTAFEGAEIGSRTVATTAIELARALRRIAPGDPEAAGLLALLLLTDARAATRTGPRGEVVTLEHADRALWSAELIGEGLDLAATALPAGGRFALEAGISGLHSQAPDWQTTDWGAICALYDRLVERWPTPPAVLARVVARSYRDGAQSALAELDSREFTGSTARQATAVRADLLRRLGRNIEARATYEVARAQEENAPVRDFFARRIDELG